MGRILLVDDEVKIGRVLASCLRQDQHEISEVSGVKEAWRSLTTHSYDAVFTVQKMADGSAETVLTAVRDLDATVSVVFLLAAANPGPEGHWRDSGVDFLSQPFHSEWARAAARRACERTRLLRESILLKELMLHPPRTSMFCGESPAIRAVKSEFARLGPSQACVLITGEMGTGKESAAREIHRCSPRALRPFVVVNCTSIAEPQLENELFGSEKDVSGGQTRKRRGLFEAAHESTLFLDEVAEISLATQNRLRRILTDGQLFRVGSANPRIVDVRVLAATRQDLEQRVRGGLWRAELFHLLAMVPLHLPPLRNRREDIPDLCKMFSAQVANELKLPSKQIVAQAVEELKSYHFPGNLRELRNLIEHAYIRSTHNKITPTDLLLPHEQEAAFPMSRDLLDSLLPPSSSLPNSFDLPALLEKAEKELIARTLESTGGAQAEAARRMGLPRSVLAYKLNKYKLRFRSGSGPKHPPGQFD